MTFGNRSTPDERRARLGADLAAKAEWLLSGSVATWSIDSLEPSHGVFLNMPKEVRLLRLMNRQRAQFGPRIDPGGDVQEEHESFMEWAAGYEDRSGPGRNSVTDRAFLEAHCGRVLVVAENIPIEEIVSRIISFLDRR